MLSEKFWKKYFEVYDILNKVIPYQQLIAEVKKEVGQNGIILDAGSGTGNFSIAVKESGNRVISLDNSKSAVEVHLAKDGEAEIVVADMTEVLPFSDNFFDAVICCLTLHVVDLDKRSQVVKEFFRVLKPGGHLILVNPSITFKPLRIYYEHLRADIKGRGFKKVLFDVFTLITPTLRMFYYNLVIEISGGFAKHGLLKKDEQRNLLVKSGFIDLGGTIDIYANSAILDKGRKPTGEREFDLQSYYRISRFVDWDNELILSTAKKATLNLDDNKKKAIALFEYVRDEFPYRFGGWQKKASEVLEQGHGMCTNKAVLLVALLRACDIPAGFGVLRVLGQEYFGKISPRMFNRVINKTSVHYYVVVFLNNQWIRIDPSTDKVLSEKTGYFNPTTELVNWDGENDAMEKISPDHILDDFWPISNIDKSLEKKRRTASGVVLLVGNYYLNFLRNNSVEIINPETDLEPLFKKWMIRKNIIIYLLYLFVSHYKYFKNKLKQI